MLELQQQQKQNMNTKGFTFLVIVDIYHQTPSVDWSEG